MNVFTALKHDDPIMNETAIIDALSNVDTNMEFLCVIENVTYARPLPLPLDGKHFMHFSRQRKNRVCKVGVRLDLHKFNSQSELL